MLLISEVVRFANADTTMNDSGDELHSEKWQLSLP